MYLIPKNEYNNLKKGNKIGGNMSDCISGGVHDSKVSHIVNDGHMIIEGDGRTVRRPPNKRARGDDDKPPSDKPPSDKLPSDKLNEAIESLKKRQEYNLIELQNISKLMKSSDFQDFVKSLPEKQKAMLSNMTSSLNNAENEMMDINNETQNILNNATEPSPMDTNAAASDPTTGQSNDASTNTANATFKDVSTITTPPKKFKDVSTITTPPRKVLSTYIQGADHPAMHVSPERAQPPKEDNPAVDLSPLLDASKSITLKDLKEALEYLENDNPAFYTKLLRVIDERENSRILSKKGELIKKEPPKSPTFETDRQKAKKIGKKKTIRKIPKSPPFQTERQKKIIRQRLEAALRPPKKPPLIQTRRPRQPFRGGKRKRIELPVPQNTKRAAVEYDVWYP